MKILVTGTTGLVGHLVARQLVEEGHHIRVMVRNTRLIPEIKKIFPDTINADLTNPPSLREAVKDVDVVVHCAALVGSGRATTEMYMIINARGTQALLDAARDAGVGRFVFTSTVGVYGTNTMKPNVDETTPYSGANGYTNSKIAAEKSIIASGIPYTILRPYWITGEGDRFLIPQVASMLLHKNFTYIGDGEQIWSLSAIENVSSAIALSATHPAAANQIYNVADAQVKIKDTVNAIADGLGLPHPTRHSSLASVFLRSIFSTSPDKRLNIDLLFPLWRGLTINAEKIRRELSWEPRVPWQESIQRGVMEWKKANLH